MPPARWILLPLCVIALAAAPSPQQSKTPTEAAPIIDMHLHALEAGPRFGLCIPWATQFSPRDPRRSWKEIWFEAMTKPPCPDPIWSTGSEEITMRETIDVLERRNIIGVLSGPADLVRKWHEAAPDRFIPSLQFKIGRDDVSPEAMRELFTKGGFAVLGEVSNQYCGHRPG